MPDLDHDPVNHPRHYNNHPSGHACIELSRCCSSDVGQAVQYVWRADLKNGTEDLRKAEWYLLDAVTHDDEMFLSVAARATAQAIITDLLPYEEGWRANFYQALSDLDLEWAHTCVQALVLEAVGELQEGDA